MIYNSAEGFHAKISITQQFMPILVTSEGIFRIVQMQCLKLVQSDHAVEFLQDAVQIIDNIVTAIMYVAVNTKVTTSGGDTFNNNAIADCVMGGTSMSGGIASISGSFIGIIVIALLRVGISAVKIPMANGVLTLSPDWQYIITGIIVALAVYTDARSSARKR